MLLRRIVPLVLVLSGVIYSAYWFHASRQMSKAVIAWTEARRAEGWQVEYDGPDISGFPAAIALRVDKPVIATPAGIGWRGPAVTVTLSPFDPRTLHVVADGHHGLAVGPWSMDGDFAQLRGDIGFTLDGALRDFHASARTATVAVAGAESLSAEGLAVALTPLAAPSPITHVTPTIGFSVSASGLDLPVLPGLVLERRIAQSEIAGRLLGAVPPGPPLPAIAAWSADGGTIAIDRLVLNWDPMALEGEGTLALDSQMQPLAAFSARVRGFGPLVDRLGAAGIVQPGAIAAGRMLLALMAKPDAQGRPTIPIPVTIQDGAVWLGPARVAAVPVIPWAVP
jgi:Uncharacterized protein conserved in bacteria (DUF2125)